MIDEVHIVDARWTGRHASKARQTAVDMLDSLFVGRAAFFQHLFDEIDPPSRGIKLIAQQRVGWTSRRAETTMDALPQDLIRSGSIRVRKLGFGKIRLHEANALSEGAVLARPAKPAPRNRLDHRR